MVDPYYGNRTDIVDQMAFHRDDLRQRFGKTYRLVTLLDGAMAEVERLRLVVSPQEPFTEVRRLRVEKYDKQLKAMARAICRACDEDPDCVSVEGNRYRWEDYMGAAKAARSAAARSNPEPIAKPKPW